MKKIRNFIIGIIVIITVMLGTISATNNIDVFEISKNIDIFISIFKELNMYYVDKIDASTTIRKGIDAMLKDLDPYTEFYSESEIESFRMETTGRYGGIGSVISQRDDFVYIEEPYEGMPAHKAGLKIGDKIISIDNKSTKNKTSNDISKLLKGSAGTSVKIGIARLTADGSEKKMEFDVVRQEIKIKSIPFSGMINDKTGYLILRSFTEKCGSEVRDSFKSLKAANPNMNSFILDLRGNPGGLLNEAIDISNIFIDEGLEIVSTKGKVQEWNVTYKTRKKSDDSKIDLVVLINGGSASASEIVSGAIQDYDRGVIIGTKTFGKGLVQQTRPLPYNTQLKVTTSKYYIPSGRCIQAINYSLKDSSGSALKVPDSLKVAFKTKNGRTVYDGGGIDPDIKTKKEFFQEITAVLMIKGLFSKYANNYTLKNQKIANSINFKLSDNDFNLFVDFIKKQNIDFESQVENNIVSIEKSLIEDKNYDFVKNELLSLKNKIKENKYNQINQNKKDILELLESEISKRWYSNDEHIKRNLIHDEDIKQALKVFENKEEYKKYLKK